MITKITNEQIAQLMANSDYRDRFVAEYIKLKQRYEKLKAFNNKIEAARGTEHFHDCSKVCMPKHDCPDYLLKEQQRVMGEYLHILEVRAVIEDIDLQDAIMYLANRASPCGCLRPTAYSSECTEDCEELIEENRLELSVCCDCIHYPICNYLVGRLEKFKLPREKQSCDLFESVNGYGEDRLKDESDVTLK